MGHLPEQEQRQRPERSRDDDCGPGDLDGARGEMNLMSFVPNHRSDLHPCLSTINGGAPRALALIDTVATTITLDHRSVAARKSTRELYDRPRV